MCKFDNVEKDYIYLYQKIRRKFNQGTKQFWIYINKNGNLIYFQNLLFVWISLVQAVMT